MIRTLNPATVSALIYTTISVAAAALFFVVTNAMGGYTWVARIGGSGWVLLLSFIITMPTVTPWIKRRMSASPGPVADDARTHLH